MLQILQYPFSRGNIHIETASVLEKPCIDPKYYGGRGGEVDLAIMIECAKFAEKITKTHPLASIVRGRVAPPAQAKTDEELRDWLVKETICDWSVLASPHHIMNSQFPDACSEHIVLGKTDKNNSRS